MFSCVTRHSVCKRQ